MTFYVLQQADTGFVKIRNGSKPPELEGYNLLLETNSWREASARKHVEDTIREVMETA